MSMNIREFLSNLVNGDGATLKDGKKISYKTGWQVADYGKETTNVDEAEKMVKEMNGNCGIWLDNGVYYIDHSFRVKTLKKALEVGRKFNQISVYGWERGNLRYC